MTDEEDLRAFYERGLEEARLSAGTGALELARTQVLLERYLPRPPALVVDVGGGPGRYAVWLTSLGYRVHLIDPVPLHVEQAKAVSRGALAGAEVGDARALAMPDASADAVILLGPLYHLPQRADRVQALAEARRVCRPGGRVIAAAISRYASTLDGLRECYLEDPGFAAIAAQDRKDGVHRNPSQNPAYFTTAYFHRPDELPGECIDAGLAYERTVGVEGVAWLLPDIEARLADPARREVLLRELAEVESEPSLIGASAHLLLVARCR